MESEPFHGFYRGKRVFVTGHTGFKGSWLCEWLLQLGAEVMGFALRAPTQPALFEELKLGDRIEQVIADLAEAETLARTVDRFRPDVVFHLAAQPLVRLSYEEPVATYATNVMGTIHLLQALRRLSTPCAAVLATTDKCYENREWMHSYREEDALGGHDPYSSSKACAEIAIASFRRSFFRNHPVRMASARAGNVIGGGDWAVDRLVPDCMRALEKKEPILVRNRYATRPWQHVLEPLGGYLQLASRLGSEGGLRFEGAFNLGPPVNSNRTVAEFVAEVLKHWPGQWIDAANSAAVHEARLLHLATDKAWHLLGWRAVWDFKETLAHTVAWYRYRAEGDLPGLAKLTRKQLHDYTAAAARAGLEWAGGAPREAPLASPVHST